MATTLNKAILDKIQSSIAELGKYDRIYISFNAKSEMTVEFYNGPDLLVTHFEHMPPEMVYSIMATGNLGLTFHN